MEFLSKVIYQRPRPIDLSSVLSKNNFILEANDVYYKEDKRDRWWMTCSYGIFILIFPVASCFPSYIGFWPLLIMWTLMGIPGIIVIIYGFIAPPKTMVFNRLEGVITVAPRFQKEFDIPFETGVGIRAFTHNETSGIDQHLSFSVSKEKKRKGGVISDLLVDDSWAFMVWYMDKNRPLPPGDAFEAYRDRDFERRKAEGFLAPLYLSYIPTPEATKEQQTLRDLYWKDRDYMIE